MERRNFLRNSLLATGGMILGGSIIYRIFGDKGKTSEPNDTNIKLVYQGNKKNVLVLMSAGARNGNTDRLTDAYINGLAEAGHTVTKVFLGSMHIEGCRGCGVCQRRGNVCAIKDDMQRIYPLFKQCDVLVMASPLYFWTVTSHLKAFIERLYAISVKDKYPTKETVLLMTAGDDNAETFAHPLRYFHIIAEIFGGKEVGHYFAGGCTGCENITRHIDKKHLDNAYQLGLNLV